MINIRIGITDFVGFLCRKGNISSEFANYTSALEGVHLHQMVQKSRPEDYQSEVTLFIQHQFEDKLELTLSGRADGIFYKEDSWWIEEIKSTSSDLEYVEANHTHLAQAKLYAYIYCTNKNLRNISIQLTYIHADSKEEKHFLYSFNYDELNDFYLDQLNLFYHFYQIIHQHRISRDESIQSISFPYQSFRTGQKEMAISCFKAIKNNEILFIQAPTGIGKTLSTLYPAIQSLGKSTSKVMYLTAKTITRQVAVDTTELMKSQGTDLNYVVITAKEKICFLEKSNCNAEHCPYANGHYDRINDALLDILKNETSFNREIIEQYAIKHQVCPFEYSLDIFNFSDISISDYNYAFDPKVNLKRAFETANDYTLLVDEAHNLVDRSRQMYSAEIDFNQLKKVKKLFKPKKGKLYRSLKKIIDDIENIDAKDQFIQKELHKELINHIQNFVSNAKEKIVQIENGELKEALIDIYFMMKDVMRISEFYNENYITYYENKTLKFLCLDASQNLREIYKKCQSVILFSATLLPISYFFSLNGGKEGDKKLYFTSPFPKEHQLLLVADDIKTTYRYRDFSYIPIKTYIEKLIQYKKGHYLIFFPSYAYMNQVASLFNDIDVFIQTPDMSEEDKENFLKAFETEQDKTKLFFCVLGGIFSEGIDLKGDQVIGVVIVSVGLPQLCLERDLIKEHQGYEYAYVYPGFNKVLQAAGRLIRTMDDRGVILLLDHRYLTKDYLTLFPQEWHHAQTTNLNKIDEQLSKFLL